MKKKYVDYSSQRVPQKYKCSRCGAAGVKLWRGYEAAAPIELFCAPCAASSESVTIDDMDANGFHASVYGQTNEVGNLVPAIPDEEGAGYWGHLSVPRRGIEWWRKLPTLPSKK